MRLIRRAAISQLVVVPAVATSPATASAQANITFDGMSGNISGTAAKDCARGVTDKPSLLCGPRHPARAASRP